MALQLEQYISKIQMKDRWKIMLIVTIVGLLVSILFLFIGFSFKTVGLREYGLLEYSFYQTVDADQTVRQNGNYLVGLDYSFIPYPKGILMHNFTVNALSKDKSMIGVDGVFLGRLIQSQILGMHFNYGPQYFKVVGKAVEQAFRQSLQKFLLTEIISDRVGVNAYVSSNVCLNVESKYSFIDCEYVSTGILVINAKPIVLYPETAVQQLYKKILEETIDSQKRINVYENGGFDLIQNVQKLNGELFLNVSKLVVQTVSNFSTEGSEIFGGGVYIIKNGMVPWLDNQIQFWNK